MCGIVGYISLDHSINPEQLETATSCLSHRGPDAQGFYFSEDGCIGLGHRRLSILDLSDVADQPMTSADGRYVIIFNGEIYNFKELINQLSDKGKSLKTTSDTEVILELFAQNGHSAFSMLNGMFALAIYDKYKSALTLCRDHSGIKPLYIYFSEKELIFASELKAIKNIKGDALSINKDAIPYFLHLGFIPAPHSIYKNVQKFPSAHFLEISLDATDLSSSIHQAIPFWHLEDHIDQSPMQDETTAKMILKDLLLDSVEKQMVSDVPVGTFLSGGVDSSLITALAAEVNPGKIETFSLSIDSGKYNEAVYAKQVSKHLKTEHHQFNVKQSDVIGLIDKLIPAYDEPFADSSAFPTMMVSQLAKKHVTVALSGDGGDELFMGYGMHRWAKRLDDPMLSMSRKSISLASKVMGDKYKRIGKLFDWPDDNRKVTHIFSQEQYMFSEKELEDLLTDHAFAFDIINNVTPAKRSLEAAEKQSLWDYNYYLQDDLLVKVDRASMQYSLETRVPLLDHRIVEFAFNLDPGLKMRQGTMKYLLKEVLYDYVPRQLFDRPKWGFTIPLAKWLNTDLKYLLDKYCNENIIRAHALLNWDEVKRLKEKYYAGSQHLYNRLWLIIVLHWWLEENK